MREKLPKSLGVMGEELRVGKIKRVVTIGVHVSGRNLVRRES